MIDATPTTSAPSRAVRLPRLGFAGAGWIVRHRLEAIAQAGVAEIAAVFDPSAEAVAAVRPLAPGICHAPTFGELLDLPLDGIVIATPSALHASQAVAALQSGKAVFCQKPLARTAAETRVVLEAARTVDRLLGVDLSYRGHRGMQRIRELVQQGALGRIYAVEGVFHNAYGPDKTWFYDARLSGGGCLLDLGIHLVDLALWCLDFPGLDSARGQLLAAGRPLGAADSVVEDYAAAQLTLAGGTSLQFACSWKAPAGCDARIGLTFFGTDGGASFRNVGGSFYDFVAEEFRPDRTRHRLTPAGAGEGWGGVAVTDWCRQMADSPAFDPSVNHLEAVAAALDRLYGRSP